MTKPKGTSVLARIWRSCAMRLNSIPAVEGALQLLSWMPAHATRAPLGVNAKLFGSGVHSSASLLDWLAARLAELAAKRLL